MLILPSEAPHARLPGRFQQRYADHLSGNSSARSVRLCTRNLFQSFIGNRLYVAIAKNVERRAEASKEFPLRHIWHWNAWQRGAVDERASGSIHKNAMAVNVSGAQFGDLTDAAGNWIEMAGAARIGVIKRPESLREGIMLVELHCIGNVISLRRNESIGLIVERRNCFRGAR